MIWLPASVSGDAHHGLLVVGKTGGLGGAFVWPSLIRKLDRLDASYAT